MTISLLAAQNMLMQLGFDLGPSGADGRYGPATRAAVTAFQRSQGLFPDGILGPVTMAALQAAIAGTSSTAAADPPRALVTSSRVQVRGAPFAAWFNEQVRIQARGLFPHPLSEVGFTNVFDRAVVLGVGLGLTFNEFIALFCIFYNETGGTLRSLSEMGGPAYCFGTNGGRKSSYNVARNGNRLAGDQLRQRGVLRDDASVTLWNGTVWPEETDPGLLAALNECDFYKYRGRGLCQITWRSGYLAYVDPALAILGVTSESLSERELSRLMETDVRVYCRATALYLHDPSWAGFVLPRVNNSPPDFYSLGQRVSGSARYADLYQARCYALLNGAGDEVRID